MYSKVKLLGHPVHPMLVSYPIAFYTATAVSWILFVTTSGGYIWVDVAIAANVAGVIMAVVAAVPGFIDWSTGIPAGTAAKRHGTIHMSLNVLALVLMLVNAALHLDRWTMTIHPHSLSGFILALAAVACTIVAGYFGWIMVQNDHVGVAFSAQDQPRLDPTGRETRRP
jgi:uncharacterized membrane protein